MDRKVAGSGWGLACAMRLPKASNRENRALNMRTAEKAGGGHHGPGRPCPYCRRAGRRQAGSDLVGVLGQNLVTLHHGQGGSVNLLGGDVGGAEDLVEVLAGHGGKASAILGGYTHDDGVGGQGFTLTAGHVLGQLVHDAAQYQHGLAVVGQLAAGVTSVGAGGHAEGGVTGGTVGDGSHQVRGQAALTFEQHVTPAATRAARGGSEGIKGSGSQQRSNEKAFHDSYPSVGKKSRI